MGRMDGKVAVVTGAASGIGLACVSRFASEGARVVGLDIAEPHVELTLPSGASEVSFAQGDVRDEDTLARVFDAVVAQHGRVDAVITAAGVAGGGPAHLLDRRCETKDVIKSRAACTMRAQHNPLSRSKRPVPLRIDIHAENSWPFLS